MPDWYGGLRQRTLSGQQTARVGAYRQADGPTIRSKLTKMMLLMPKLFVKRLPDSPCASC